MQNVNCPTMKFNQGTSWPVQAGTWMYGMYKPNFSISLQMKEFMFKKKRKKKIDEKISN